MVELAAMLDALLLFLRFNRKSEVESFLEIKVNRKERKETVNSLHIGR